MDDRRSEAMTFKEVQQEIQDANLVLVGIGEEIPDKAVEFYENLAKLLHKKDYFIVSLKDRESLEKAGLEAKQITVPFSEQEPKESWDEYLHWLSFTLNQKLCILELGVGFLKPELIRFPFEKTSYFNQKSKFIRINENFPQLAKEIADRGISIKRSPVEFFTEEQLFSN